MNDISSSIMKAPTDSLFKILTNWIFSHRRGKKKKKKKKKSVYSCLLNGVEQYKRYIVELQDLIINFKMSNKFSFNFVFRSFTYLIYINILKFQIY